MFTVLGLLFCVTKIVVFLRFEHEWWRKMYNCYINTIVNNINIIISDINTVASNINIVASGINIIASDMNTVASNINTMEKYI